jgi:tryptophan 2,3-dioxygenase
MLNERVLHELERWTAAGHDTLSFPLDVVIREFRRVGKHSVDPRLREALAKVRADLPPGADQLRRFLDTALDKYDRRFDNPSYLALHDIPMPTTAGGCPLHTEGAERQRDRLIALFVADVLRFELAALDGTTELLPLLRPDARVVSKRCALGLRLLRVALPRIGIDAETGTADAIESARILCARIEAGQTPEERRMLAVTLLTVYTAHDEHLFVRMLQCYEVGFALVGVQLRAAILALHAGNANLAVDALRAAAASLDECTPLFSLVATMQPEAFMAFREFTDGASAIQSRSYKTIESLCRRPDADRLAGPGYDAVPEVRAKVLAGQPTLEDALARASLQPAEAAEIRAAMAAFEGEVMGWRRTHHNLAMRMLGMRRGTGYTAGVPYLAEARDIPVFRCPFAHAYDEAA